MSPGAKVDVACVGGDGGDGGGNAVVVVPLLICLVDHRDGPSLTLHSQETTTAKEI